MNSLMAKLTLSMARAYTTRFNKARGVSRLTHIVQTKALPALPRGFQVTVVTDDGRRFTESVHEPWFLKLMMLGRRDPAETRLIERLIKPGDTVIDIGANYGWYTTLLGKLVGPTGRVHAFEAAPPTVDLLKRNLAGNQLGGEIVVNAFGLSDKTGTATIHVPLQHGGASLKPYHQYDVNKFEIALTTLDEYVTKNAVGDVKFIKLDVEGSEFPIIRGANKLLSSARPPMWLTEFARATSRPFGYEPEEMFAFLAKFGYRFASVREEPLGTLAPLPDFTKCDDEENILCYHDAAREAVEKLFN